jgi:hypothetical protein
MARSVAAERRHAHAAAQLSREKKTQAICSGRKRANIFCKRRGDPLALSRCPVPASSAARLSLARASVCQWVINAHQPFLAATASSCSVVTTGKRWLNPPQSPPLFTSIICSFDFLDAFYSPSSPPW